MKCPYCGAEMIPGKINQDRYGLKWVAYEKDKGVLNWTPLEKGIKLTSAFSEKLQSFVEAHCCVSCKKMIIDLENFDLNAVEK